jgi:DNA-binding HxlR family transcriptional regulator
MNIPLLVNLTSKAWSLKILALMHGGVPGRQAPLIAAAQASRSAFASSLDHLIRIGMLERNPGYGHPLRPEFRLTQAGIPVAAMASRILELVPEDKDFTLVRRSWAVPVLAVTSTPKRFMTIKAGLNTITDRALSKSLHALEEQDWIRRDIDLSSRAPFPTYQAVNAGEKISKTIGLSI